MLKYYKLRIDVISDNSSLYRELESRYFLSWVRSLESVDGDNTHYHYYIETDSTSDAIRQYIRKYIGKGNGIYSLKELDEIRPMEYLSYIVKDDTKAVFYNLPEDLKDEVLAHSKQVKLAIKEKKAKRKTRFQSILEACENSEKSIEGVSKDIYYYYLDNNMVPSPSQVINYTWAVCLKRGIMSFSQYRDSQLRFLKN